MIENLAPMRTTAYPPSAAKEEPRSLDATLPCAPRRLRPVISQRPTSRRKHAPECDPPALVSGGVAAWVGSPYQVGPGDGA